MGFPKGFLWGGSISAAQIEGGWNEGGKSPVLVDYCTAGSTKERRQIWYLDKDGKRVHRNWEAVDELEEGCKFAFFDDLYYTNHVASDFYHRYKEDLKKWDIQHLIHPFHGQEFIHMELKVESIKKVLNSTEMFLRQLKNMGWILLLHYINMMNQFHY